jgi:virulence factor Mce-like protein
MMTHGTKKAFAVAVTVAAVTSACATNGLGSLPLPAPGTGAGGYTLTAVFSNALNLPAHAKVKVAGADVGDVESITAQNYTAVTSLRIMDGVPIPVGSIAELRSATPLGDVFVAIKPPTPLDPTAKLLKGGDTIGLESTSAAATVEAVLSSTALLVNGGAIRNLTNIVNGAGKATGDRGQAFGHLINQTNDLLARLNARSDQIETAVSETARLADTMATRNQAISDILSAAGPATELLSANAGQLADVTEQAGAIARQLAKFPSIAGTDGTGRSLVKDANTIVGSWNDVALSSDVSLSALNRLIPLFIKITSSQSISVQASIDRLVLGSRPDIGFAGDPAFHGPMRPDWNKMIGSLKYALWRLQERVVGQGPNTSMGQNQWTPAGPPLPPAPVDQPSPDGTVQEPPK